MKFVFGIFFVICAAVLAVASAPRDAAAGRHATHKDALNGSDKPLKAETTKVLSRWDHQKHLDDGVKFLLQSQNADGSWGSPLPRRPYEIMTGSVNTFHAFGNASSALCCMALLMQPRTDTIDAAVTRGFKFLADAPDAARVNGRIFYNVWAHAYMLEALALGLRDERMAELAPKLKQRAAHELRRLLSIQALDGGFGYYDFRHRLSPPSGNLSTSFTTACALAALHELKLSGMDAPAHNIRIALDYLERQRVPNGAYVYSTGHVYYPHGEANKIRGSLGRSQAGDNALITWDRTLKTQDIDAAFDRFFEHHVFIEIGRGRQWPHEAWYATAPYYYYFGHYYAARNLDHLHDNTRRQHAMRLSDLIARTQYDDGSFWDYPLFGYTKAYGTGFGVLILSRCKRCLE